MTIARYGRQAKSAFARWSHQLKRPHGLCAKLTAVVILGLCFVFIWSFFSSTPNSFTDRRESFGEIAEPATAVHTPKVSTSSHSSRAQSHKPQSQKRPHQTRSSKNTHLQSDLNKKKKSASVRVDKGAATVNPSKSRHSSGSNKEIGRKKEIHGVRVKLNSTEELIKEGDGIERSELLIFLLSVVFMILWCLQLVGWLKSGSGVMNYDVE